MAANRYEPSAMIESFDGRHRSGIDIWGGGSALYLLSKPVADGVVAEKGYDADFAVETL
jgi:hypothetical protein